MGKKTESTVKKDRGLLDSVAASAEWWFPAVFPFHVPPVDV